MRLFLSPKEQASKYVPLGKRYLVALRTRLNGTKARFLQNQWDFGFCVIEATAYKFPNQHQDQIRITVKKTERFLWGIPMAIYRSGSYPNTCHKVDMLGDSAAVIKSWNIEIITVPSVFDSPHEVRRYSFSHGHMFMLDYPAGDAVGTRNQNVRVVKNISQKPSYPFDTSAITRITPEILFDTPATVGLLPEIRASKDKIFLFSSHDNTDTIDTIASFDFYGNHIKSIDVSAMAVLPPEWTGYSVGYESIQKLESGMLISFWVFVYGGASRFEYFVAKISDNLDVSWTMRAADYFEDVNPVEGFYFGRIDKLDKTTHVVTNTGLEKAIGFSTEEPTTEFIQDWKFIAPDSLGLDNDRSKNETFSPLAHIEYGYWDPPELSARFAAKLWTKDPETGIWSYYGPSTYYFFDTLYKFDNHIIASSYQDIEQPTPFAVPADFYTEVTWPDPPE
jgi:hypothetical protein